MIFGVNEKYKVFLKCLGYDASDIPRFRDCFLQGDKIVIHTRTGGGNREDYEDDNDRLAANQYYISDSDDDFDCTYANFYFKFPPEFEEDLKAISEKDTTKTPSEKWKAFLDITGAV